MQEINELNEINEINEINGINEIKEINENKGRMGQPTKGKSGPKLGNRKIGKISKSLLFFSLLLSKWAGNRSIR